MSNLFHKAVARHGMPYLSVHGLRHSWATLALQAGVHPKIVQERLGHSTISITLDIYSHVNPAMDVDAANTVAALIRARFCDQQAVLTPQRGRPVPLTCGNTSRCASGWRDSNPRPLRPERSALPSCATPRQRPPSLAQPLQPAETH